MPPADVRHLLWIPIAGAVGFLVAFAFGDRAWLPVDVYYLLYSAGVFGFFIVYARRTGLDLRGLFARRWKAGLVLGVLFGAALMRNVFAQPEAGRLTGAALAWALVWRGVVYGAADGLLLLAFPWTVAWRALRAEGAPAGTKLRAGIVAYAAILCVTAAYHLGYRDFRSPKLAQPVVGSAIASWATLLTANPLAAPLAHIFMHTGAVLHQPAGGLFLPPHRPHAAGARP